MKKIKVLILIAFIFSLRVYSQNTNPVVTEVAFSILGTTVTVNYKVADAEQLTVTIQMEVSSNSGTAWDFNYGTATGDIGAGISTGTDLKTITWTYEGSYNANFKIRIIADDLVGDQIYYSGKIYNTVIIWGRPWLKENLDVGTYVASINTGTSHSDVSNNGIIEKYCYGNNKANCDTYGGLYDWNEAMQYVTTQGAQGICPTGWHIPTYAEFINLRAWVESDGNALKAIEQGSGAGAGTNTSGFSALLAGGRYNEGFFFFPYNGYFWSSSSDANNTFSFYFYVLDTSSSCYLNDGNKNTGYSVRCIQD